MKCSFCKIQNSKAKLVARYVEPSFWILQTWHKHGNFIQTHHFFIPTVKLKLHLKSKLINPSNRLIEIVNIAEKRGIHRMKTLKIEPGPFSFWMPPRSSSKFYYHPKYPSSANHVGLVYIIVQQTHSDWENGANFTHAKARLFFA